MHLTRYLSTFLAVSTSTAFARPAPMKKSNSNIGQKIGEAIDKYLNSSPAQEQCMPRKDALKVAETFQSLIRGYTKKKALATLTPDFVDHTSAVSIIINKGGSEPEGLTEPVFTSRDEFTKGHGTQEPIPFSPLKVWHTCDGVVSMVWESLRSGKGQENETAAVPVVGVAVLETELPTKSTDLELERARAGGYNCRIHTLWSEFNTAAWLVNNGGIKLDPSIPTTPVPQNESIAVRSPGHPHPKQRGPLTKFNVGMV